MPFVNSFHMVHIIDFAPYYPPHVGGVEAYAHDLHKALLSADSGTHVTVVTARIRATIPPQDSDPRLQIVARPSLEPVRNFPIPLGFLGRLGLPKPDLVITHTRFFPASFVGASWAERMGAPHLHIEHGSSPVLDGGPAIRLFARLYDRTFSRTVMRRATDVLAVSGAASRYVKATFGREPVVAFRGYEVSKSPRANPARSKSIIFVGRLVNAKGVHELIEAFATLRHEGWSLALLGDGPERPRLEERISDLGLKGRVSLVGAVSPEDVPSWLASAGMLVNPSHTEGLPTAVLEAAAAGLPVIATDVGGTSEVVKHETTGLLVPPRSTEDLGSSIEHLMRHPTLRQSMGLKGRYHVEANFTWQPVLDLIDDVLAGRR